MPEQSCPKCGRPVEIGQPCQNCLLLLASEPTDALDADLSDVSISTDSPQNPPTAQPAADPDIETVRQAFQQLEILEKIGRGGMGTVFKARQPKLDRFVALKILSSELATKPTFAERFAREGKLLAKLNHPNIVAVYDFGESNGFYFLLMEYVDGVNMRQAMREEKFTPEQAIAIVPKICDALQYAHDEGVLHRDIKPENILLDTKGRVKIADFGIGRFNERKSRGCQPPDALPSQNAQSSGGYGEYAYTPGSYASENLTQTGQILGTPSYMAPEQLADPNAVDHRADIYSLGVVFYELLTGELPRGVFSVPSEKTPVGADVDRIVMKAIERKKENRYQTVMEMKKNIETAQVSENKHESISTGTLPLGLLLLAVIGMICFAIPSYEMIRNLFAAANQSGWKSPETMMYSVCAPLMALLTLTAVPFWIFSSWRYYRNRAKKTPVKIGQLFLVAIVTLLAPVPCQLYNVDSGQVFLQNDLVIYGFFAIHLITMVFACFFYMVSQPFRGILKYVPIIVGWDFLVYYHTWILLSKDDSQKVILVLLAAVYSVPFFFLGHLAASLANYSITCAIYYLREVEKSER